ncbi:flagellar hook protein FlgK [Anoxybacillus gonensis]|uniref:Flagellar hook-associated protein 1 n=1 Tax=Anoxybacillus gonensis TaxID=198467 RepID=A0AAW7TKK9_9BACL|nr:flagellar hook-associated protein FlgK [Anoxybacillus gonensis]AXM89150.1 flagellar hook-associated protein FlgK [Anoxybacillus ayderensis G10]AKS39507.1 flagellar hook protein FlgK [Anoxybacillus gonensis]KGP60608.1 flagellar hook protein FlgK [Anoxybacillus gonensis]MCX8047594.1 flagellar hook-associated protein FlgK [Anoxybacillus gonensis]MDO0877967.1 flagellar hook-associated protein FlgK [Anoxybacillus gonensis]
MRSTFHGLEVAKRGMFTQQSAIYVTGHNIANANTPDFSRQRVNFNQTEPYPAASMNRPNIPGQMGTGVEAGSIQRIRDSFLDYQYRNESTKSGYWSTRLDAISRMEDVMNEPTEFGLAKAMTQFWESLQDLSVSPENEGARAAVRQRGIAVAESFNYLHSSLTQIREDLGQQIKTGLLEVNSILRQISELNDQIKAIEPNGYLPNDLYDRRDALVDELSKYVQVKVDKQPTGGNALPIAEGIYKISIVDSTGAAIEVVSSTGYKTLSIDPSISGDPTNPNGYVRNVVLSDGTTIAPNDFANGKIKALIEAYGYGSTPTSVVGYYPDMLNKLDQMAYSFAEMFNAQHRAGYGLDNSTGLDFFSVGSVSGAAGAIQVSINDLSKIAASTALNEPGNGENALNLSKIKDLLITSGTVTISGSPVSVPIQGGTIQTFYEGFIGQIGVDGQQAQRMKVNADTLAKSVNENRQSVSSVSLDEEMTNLVKFQHAYSAAARMITVVDEMLDKIINGMGRVGI